MGILTPRNPLTTAPDLHKVGHLLLDSHMTIGVQGMKNVYEVLRQKELELARLEKEVEALRVAAPLLSDDKEGVAEAISSKPTLTNATGPQPAIRIPQPAVAAAATAQPARAAGWEDTAKRWP